ncbi:MAG: helix-turn-helix domain-containing protein [bacterium]
MQEQNLKDILYNLEIPDAQAEIYLALLKIGEGSYTEISKKTGIKRTTLYPILEKMERRGLIKKSLDKKAFLPTMPQQLFEKLQGNNLMLFHAISQFQDLMKRPEKMAKVKFYNGRKGIQQLFLDDLEAFKNKKDNIFRSVSGASFYAFDADFRDQYAKERQKTGVETRLIVSSDLKEYVKKYKIQFSMQKVKFLPEAVGNITGRIAASPARISLIGFLKDESGIMIESHELAETFIKFFDFVWGMMR